MVTRFDQNRRQAKHKSISRGVLKGKLNERVMLKVRIITYLLTFYLCTEEAKPLQSGKEPIYITRNPQDQDVK